MNLLKKNSLSASLSFSSGVFGKLCLERRVNHGGGGSSLSVQIYHQGWMHRDDERWVRIHKERRVKKVLG